MGLKGIVTPLQGFAMGLRLSKPRPLAWALFERPFGARYNPFLILGVANQRGGDPTGT